MNIEQVRNFALSLPAATERCPFGPDTLAFEVGGKIFCLLTLDGEWDFYNLKVNPEYGIELRERYRDIAPGFHMNKRHWISVKFHGDVPDKVQRELIKHSYVQVMQRLPKKLKEEISAVFMDELPESV